MAKSSKQESMSEVEFLHAYVDDYLADALQGFERERFEKLMENEKHRELVEDLKEALGKFQVQMQSYFVSEEQRVELSDLVENPEARHTREVERIEEISRWESFGDLRRRIAVVILLLAAIAGGVYYFSPAPPPEFDALQVLAYESLAMEDDPTGRLDFPSQSYDEVRAFVAADKALGFSAQLPKQLVSGWGVEGAAVIDYEVAKVVALQFFSAEKKERVFFFTYAGDISSLPKSDVGDASGLRYQVYASDDLNMVVWQIKPGVVAIFAGRLAAQDLAAMARAGSV